MAMIVFTQGPYAGSKLPLPDKGVLLGRGKKADLVLDDPQVSSQHTLLRMEDGAWCLFDLHSSNSTTVNGHAIEAVRLNEGDVVGLGETRFIFMNDASAAPAAEATAGTPPSAAAPAPPAAVAAPEPAPAIAVPVATATSAPPAALLSVVTPEEAELVKQMGKTSDAIRGEVGKVIVGQREVFDQLLACLFAGGHALLIGLPGMAKTLMATTLATVVGMKVNRVRLTSDLAPKDIVGGHVIETNRKTAERESRFIPGPIFCDMFLASEIDRAMPKTQAALLEAMQEQQVTAGSKVYALDAPFFVLATQNLNEEEGAYLLTDAQQDQFMFNIWMDYPLQEEEERIVTAMSAGGRPEPRQILTREQVLQIQSVVRKLAIPDRVVKYIVTLVCSTRCQYEEAPELTRQYVSCGAGPRASQDLALAAKAIAVLDGRIHATCSDVRRAAVPVLRHRIGTNRAADAEGIEPEEIVERLLKIIPEPGVEAPSREGKAEPSEAATKE